MKKNLPNSIRAVLTLTLLLLLSFSSTVEAQKSKKSNSDKQPAISEQLYSSIEYRELGPFRGGRSAAVTGVPGQPNLYYFGATGGGVWRTKDGGQSWENISDGFFGGSIGAVEVAQSRSKRNLCRWWRKNPSW